MTWQITAKTGVRRGVSWVVGDRPLTLGRSLNCDIIVSDPTVSRRHCEIIGDGARVRFRDLGSRNVTLINGRVASECYLDVGDELSLGTDSFIVTRASIAEGGGRSTPPRRLDNTTLSLHTSLAMAPGELGREDSEHPATAQEMVRLFQLSQQLHRASSTYEFATLCLLAIQDVFPAPAEAHVCFRQPDNTLDTFPRHQVLPDRTLMQIEQVLKDGRSVLKFERKHGFRAAGQLCISPLRSEDGSRAALLVISQVKSQVLDEADLARLDSMAGVAALHLAPLQQRGSRADVHAIADENEPADIFGNSAVAAALREAIWSAAQTRFNTLILGESGTGKEVAARMIHRQSPPPCGALISANCEVIAGEPFARTLLGEERETDGGGRLIEAGLLDQANGGTLVLLQIGALTADNQRLLTRVLAQQTFVRIGSAAEVSFHGRLIVTSRTELDSAVRDGHFRADLLKAIGRLRIIIAPLRHRRSDIRELAQHFLGLEKKRVPHRISGLTEEALGYLEELPLWGNAAELRTTIAHAVRRGRGDWLETHDLGIQAEEVDSSKENVSLDPLEHAERTLIAAVVRQCGGDTARAAQILGISELEIARVARQFAGIGAESR